MEVCKKHFYIVEELEVFEDAAPAHRDDESKEGSRESHAVEEIDPKRKEQFLWPISDPSKLFYSLWNQEVEGFYM